VDDNPRIHELRRRLEKDPASIAFAQLAEEYRREGKYAEAVETCRNGLALHPGYLSARVTLGRSLIELNRLDLAQTELTEVLQFAPENLAAIRGLAEVHRRRGELPEALEQYRTAFELARHDPGIDQIVREIRKEIEPGRAPATNPSFARFTPRPAPTRTAVVAKPDAPPSSPVMSAARLEAERVSNALGSWLDAIIADRQRRHAALR
jgi:tetratricopeptide (TPR) repeat protein